MTSKDSNFQKTQTTLHNYFTKEPSNKNIIKQCLSCKESLTTEQYLWHRDYNCKNSQLQKLNVAKQARVSTSKKKSRKKNSAKISSELRENSLLEQVDEIPVIILDNSDNEDYVETNKNIKDLDRSDSPLLFNLNDDSNVYNMSSCISKGQAEKKKEYLQDLENDWCSPENSPSKQVSNVLASCSSTNLEKDLDIRSQKLSPLSQIARNESGIAPCLTNSNNDLDDFEPEKIVLKSPPKISPRRLSSIVSAAQFASITPSKNEETKKISYSKGRKLKELTPSAESNSDESDNEWLTPRNPSMIVSPQRTPTPSPFKDDSLINGHKVSPSILKSPHSYGLKVKCYNISEEKKNSNSFPECNDKSNSPSTSKENSQSVLHSPYKGKYRSRFRSAKRALYSPIKESASTIVLSPSQKYLDLPLMKAETTSPSKFRTVKGYYLENFSFIIDSVLSQPKESELLNNLDMQIIKDFRCLSLEAQKLYVRLFQRKIKWLRANKIDYKDICDTEDMYIYICELVYAEFLFSEESLTDLKEILPLLGADEVQNFCKDLKISSIGKKDDLISRIIKFTNQQKSIVSSFKKSLNNSSNILVEKVKKKIGKCVLINKDRRSVFIRIFMLFSPIRLDEDEGGGQPSHMLNLLMVSMGKRSYPSYKVVTEHSFFRTREDLFRMEKCYQLYCEVQESIDSKRWNEAELSCKKVYEYYKEIREDKELLNHDVSLPSFLRRFTAISLMLHILTYAVEVYQRLKQYKKAVNLLEELLSQEVHLQDYRGRWFDRLALNLEQHLKLHKQSFAVCERALCDPEVMVGHRLSISQRAERLLTSSKCSAISKNYDGQLNLEVFQEAPKVIIQAKSFPADVPGYKRIFINSYSATNDASPQMTMSSVEELVVSYYSTQGYSEGLHYEGRTVHVLFGLCLWDIIYSSVPDVFRSSYQSVPYDLDDHHFYDARKLLIDKRLEELEKSTVNEINERIEKVWSENEGKTCIVDWTIFKGLSHLQGLVAGLGPKVIAGICRRLAKYHRFTRSGFPDLIVWNPLTKISRIVEVKGPNDRLSTKQILWLDFLLKIGAVAEVCHVEAVGAKRTLDLKSRRVSPRKKSEVPKENNKVPPSKRRKLPINEDSGDFQEEKRSKTASKN